MKVSASTSYDIKEIKKQLLEIQSTIALIYQNLVKGQSRDCQILEKISSLPLQNEEDLIIFEQKIEEEEYYNKMVRFYSFLYSHY